MRITPFILASIAVFTTGCNTSVSTAPLRPHATDIPDAKKVISEWLSLVDMERYDEAFDRYTEGAKRRAKTKSSSLVFYRSVRQPHGSVIKRQTVAERYTAILPMLPAGEYVVIDYVTDFKNKKGVKEMVLSERVNGKWEVAGYACSK